MNRKNTIWQLRFDLAWIHILRWIVDPAGRRDFNSEVHLYLADRYARLAQRYEQLGNRKKGARFGKKAADHFRLGGGNHRPPAVAARAAIPQPPTYTDAISRSVEPEDLPPDDAA